MKRKCPEISVLLSVYNGEKYICAAVESMLQQTYSDFEFVIVDDGSRDSTAELLRRYSDQRIRIVTNEKNLGLTKSLNIGLRESCGKYIARIDADDYAKPDRLQKQYDFMQRFSGVGFLATWAHVVDEQDAIVSVLNTRLSAEDIYYTIYFRNCIVHSSVMYDRELILSIGGYDETISMGQDCELWYRVSKVTQMHMLCEPLVTVRVTSESISTRYRVPQRALAASIVKKRLQTLTGYPLTDNEIQVLQYHVFETFDDDLVAVLKHLDRINNAILTKEAVFFSNLGLRVRKITYAMKQKRRNLLYLYFQSHNPIKGIAAIVGTSRTSSDFLWALYLYVRASIKSVKEMTCRLCLKK